MNNQSIKNKKNIKKHFRTFLLFFLPISFLIIGITLTPLGIDQFNTFSNIRSYYETLRPDLIGFNEFWHTYNINAIANNWVQANIEFFIIGIIFLIIGFISLIALIIYLVIKKKKKLIIK